MYLETTVGPTEELVSVLEAKLHLREPGNDADLLIQGLISAAVGHVEAYLRRRLLTQTVVAHADEFAELQHLPTGPVQSILSVTYRTLNDTILTVDPSVYRTILNRQPPGLLPKWGKVWPIAQPGPDTVQVTMVVGYGGGEPMPPQIKSAILLMVGHLYANREATSDALLAELPLGIAALLQPHVFWV